MKNSTDEAKSTHRHGISPKIVIISPKNRTVYNFRGDLIKELQNAGFDVLVTGPNDDDREKIEELGVRFVKIPMTKNGMNAVEDLRYLISLKKLFKEEMPDITLGYTIKPVIYGAIAAKRAGVKRIYSMVTGGGFLFTSKTFKAKILKIIAKTLYKIGFKCADKVIFQNNDDINDFTAMKLLCKDKCVKVNGSGVNMERFAKAPVPNGAVFFMLSRLLVSKGVCVFLKASEILKEKRPDVRILLLGKYETIPDAVPKEYVEQFIERGIIERFDETPDVLGFYQMCSVYVLPSFREGTPRSVLEAMSVGRCVITTDATGCRETVRDGYNGFLVPPDSPEALAEKMIFLVDNPSYRNTMGENSFCFCHENFDVHKVNKQMLLYMEII